MITNDSIVGGLGYFTVSSRIASSQLENQLNIPTSGASNQLENQLNIPTSGATTNNKGKSMLLGIIFLVSVALCIGSTCLYEFYFSNEEKFKNDNGNVCSKKTARAKMIGWILSGISLVFVVFTLLLIATEK